MDERNKLRLRFALSLIIFLGLNILHAQENSSQSLALDQYLSKLPTDLTLKENEPQTYLLTTNWYNRDLNGNATGKFVIKGEYTRALSDQIVRWNNVYIEVFQDPTKSDSDTLFQDRMEGLSYKSPDDIANPDLYKNFPWTHFDKLKLNETIKSSDFEDFNVQMADWGTLRMKDLKMTWIGISKMNDEICALIQFESFVNPAKSFGIFGRSLYWGRIWVSLKDKQIEYAKLNEDVIMEITSSPDSKKFLNIQREVSFEKLK